MVVIDIHNYFILGAKLPYCRSTEKLLKFNKAIHVILLEKGTLAAPSTLDHRTGRRREGGLGVEEDPERKRMCQV